jgi:ParB family transcriptional regulator, chromosome partitioning protein
MTEKRPALGKGLSALIPEAPDPPRSGTLLVDVDQLVPNEHQPRLHMDDQRLMELADSIRTNGIIQPILVRQTGTTYQIIAGERRWRAAQQAGLTKVPVVIRDMPENASQQALELALIENIQRENLNPIDEALAYQRLSEAFDLTQEQIAAAVGKDRSTVANLMRLLKLPDEVRIEVAGGTLSMGHARAILGLPDEAAQRHAAREVIARGLSVRDTENLVRSLEQGDGESRPKKKTVDATPDVHTRAAEERLRFVLGTRVRIVRRGARGTVEIDFASEDELNRIYEHIVR